MDEPFNETIEHARADFGDEPKDKSILDHQIEKQKDLLDSLNSSVRRLERTLRPVLRQEPTADSPERERAELARKAVNDTSSPLVQILSSNNQKAVDVLVHLNNIIDTLEV